LTLDGPHNSTRSASTGSIRRIGRAAVTAEITAGANIVTDTSVNGATATGSTWNNTVRKSGAMTNAPAAPTIRPTTTGRTASTRTARRFCASGAPSAARIASSRRRIAIVNAVTESGIESGSLGESGRVWLITTSREDSGNGSGLRRAAFRRPKTAEFAPIATARIATMVIATADCARSARLA
jgi:hypothetical protein